MITPPLRRSSINLVTSSQYNLLLLVQIDVRHVRNQFIAVLVLKSVGVRELCYPKSFEDEDCDELVSHRPRHRMESWGRFLLANIPTGLWWDAKWLFTNQPIDCC